MFTVVWDNGKPCEQTCHTEDEVMKLINELEYEATNSEYYFDIWVYDEQEQDVTNLFFK